MHHFFAVLCFSMLRKVVFIISWHILVIDSRNQEWKLVHWTGKSHFMICVDICIFLLFSICLRTNVPFQSLHLIIIVLVQWTVIVVLLRIWDKTRKYCKILLLHHLLFPVNYFWIYNEIRQNWIAGNQRAQYSQLLYSALLNQ